MPVSVAREPSLWYFAPNGVGWIEIPPHVLRHFERFQQKRFQDKEAGGQLFWELTEQGHRRVVEVTGPRASDRRTRSTYKADHRQEQREIDQQYTRGRYFLGDWHTHPEGKPSPSAPDIQVIKEIYHSSENPGPGFLLVIVGTGSIRGSLSVSWCNDEVVSLERGTGPA